MFFFLHSIIFELKKKKKYTLSQTLHLKSLLYLFFFFLFILKMRKLVKLWINLAENVFVKWSIFIFFWNIKICIHNFSSKTATIIFPCQNAFSGDFEIGSLEDFSENKWKWICLVKWFCFHFFFLNAMQFDWF